MDPGVRRQDVLLPSPGMLPFQTFTQPAGSLSRGRTPSVRLKMNEAFATIGAVSGPPLPGRWIGSSTSPP